MFTAVFSNGISMTNCLGKSCSLGLLYVCVVKVCLSVCVCVCARASFHLVFEGGVW